MSPNQAHAKLTSSRCRAGVDPVGQPVIRRFFRGKTHRRGRVETRGRKLKLSRSNVKNMDAARKALIKKGDGTRSVRYKEIMKKARVPTVHRTTASRAFVREGLDVKFRPSRQKPRRTPEHEKERQEMCGKICRYPSNYFSDRVDMIIDNKAFQIPTTSDARKHAMSEKVHGQLRLRSEGLTKGFTKPNQKRHRRNLGGHALVCAGISNCKVVLWEYIQGRWGGAKAADMYKGPIMKTLKKKRGEKTSYFLVEDNDPQGYKSGLAKAAKRSLGIKTMEWPRYSPDLNPLDFSLWDNIEARMAKTAPRGRETVVAFKARLRRVAFSTPTSEVRKMVEAVRSRAKAIRDAKGGDIQKD